MVVGKDSSWARYRGLEALETKVHERPILFEDRQRGKHDIRYLKGFISETTEVDHFHLRQEICVDPECCHIFVNDQKSLHGTRTDAIGKSAQVCFWKVINQTSN